MEAKGNGKKRILIIEDDPEIRETLGEILMLENYDVETATNGKVALEYLRGNLLPHLILLDLMMPEMDGNEFRKLQLADPELSEVPVILLTAARAPNLESLRVKEYISKPIDIDKLLDAVRSYS